VMETLLAISDVNRLDENAFVARFGGVYESTPALAASAWSDHPFGDHAALVDAFRAASSRLDEPGILALLRAHPQLTAATPMTTESTGEQRTAGLNDLDKAMRMRIVSGNARYLERFGFPFIIAVRGLRPADIVAALDERLEHSPATELATAIAEVQRIAELRIAQLVAP
jgi:2-oxo-4-hydroxy-4-carboxy-5-ureidoimidazoline decarboxylase